MAWPPAHFILDVVTTEAPRTIDPHKYSTQVQRYLREFFEAVMRIRAADARLVGRADVVELVSLYDAMPSTNVFDNLSALNISLESDDRARNPPETHGTGGAWEPLASTRQYAQAAADISTYADMVGTYSSSLSELRACREVIEAAIALTCHDTRRAYLGDDERTTLIDLAKGDHRSLMSAYAVANRTMERLGLDQRIPFDPFTASDDDENRGSS